MITLLITLLTKSPAPPSSILKPAAGVWEQGCVEDSGIILLILFNP